jgi:Brp/Blh family beta-carotene 15,15'-monooxygenase
MSSLKISEINYGENWVVTGSSANMIKPTTGYAFHNMAVDANKQVKAIINQQPFIREERKKRFIFYDKLLLKILEESPQHGKKIFKNLFNHIATKNVLTFLSEKSSFGKELFIFSKLPILIFLRAAFKNITYSFTKLAPAYLAFITTIFSLIIQVLKLDEVLWLMLGLGFLSVGLSHGALDYLTDRTIQGRKQLLQFIVSYLIKGAILGIIWIGIPDLALLVFIAFSAWHFGQADFKQWKLKQGLNSFLWGFIILIIILLFHLDETIGVLQHIQGLNTHHLLQNLSINHVFIGKVSISFIAILFAAYCRSNLMLVTISYLLISSFMPLIVSFGIYFVAQHSLHGWLHLKKDLRTSSYRLWLKSLPFSLGGALLFLTFMLLNNRDYIGIFFILLSCVSMPHVLSMHHFYNGFNRTLK